MAGFNTATQFVGSLGSFKLETGYRSDVSEASGLATADLSGTHCMPTTLNHVCVGWMYCHSTGGGFLGEITGAGAVRSDFSGTTTANADYTATPLLCFTLDTTSEESTDYYLAIGW
jgi:hypothetical protein